MTNHSPSRSGRPGRLTLGAAALAIAASLPAQDDTTSPALRGLDPVSLTAGQETAGEAAHQASYGGYTYRFESAKNRATFLAAPQRFAIQMDGGCASMGPLSGRGSPDRFLVHDGRIYIFASDPCRDGFAKNPAACFDPDVARPQPSAAAIARGRELLGKAVAAHGGAERLRTLRSLAFRREYERNGYTYDLRYVVGFPDRTRLTTTIRRGDESWHYASVLAGKHSRQITDGKNEPMGPAGRREMGRRLRCRPLVALHHALTRPQAVVAVAAAIDTPAGAGGSYDRLAIWIDGVALELGLDDAGVVRTSKARARGPTQRFGELVLQFGDFETHGGVLVGTSVTGTFQGAPVPPVRMLDVAVDGGPPARKLDKDK